MPTKGEGQRQVKTRKTTTTSTKKNNNMDQTLNLSQSQAVDQDAHAQKDDNEIHDKLKMMSKDLSQIKTDLAEIMKKKDIESMIKETMNEIIKRFETKMRDEIESKIQKRCDKLQEQIDSLNFEKGKLKDELNRKNEEIKEMKNEIRQITENHDHGIKEAIKMANYNEQYSRKNNVKIMDVKEDQNESEEILKEKVCNIISHQGADLYKEEIIAIHRLPSKKSGPKPIIIKTINNNVKSKIMRKRKDLKTAGHRIADDVTKKNTGLISRLFLHDRIKSAWFFNGSVYGETNEGKRLKFDIYDNIAEIIENSKKYK